MTESEWNFSRDAYPMLVFLHSSGRWPDRKNRLFSVACCDRVWEYLEEPSRRALRIVERFADGQATEQERAAAEAEAMAVSARLTEECSQAPEIFYLAVAASSVMLSASSREDEATWRPCGQFIAEQVVQHACLAEVCAMFRGKPEPYPPEWGDPINLAVSDLLRDIIGNPFHPIALDGAWVLPDVVSIARAIYDEKSFDHMPVLGDALEEAGCVDQTILSHCRGQVQHVRGCWIVDALLGKT